MNQPPHWMLLFKKNCAIAKAATAKTPNGHSFYFARFGVGTTFCRYCNGDAGRGNCRTRSRKKRFFIAATPYTKGLIHARPPVDKRPKRLATIADYMANTVNEKWITKKNANKSTNTSTNKRRSYK